MRKSLKLFFIGVGLSFLISLSEVLELQTLPHDPVEYFIYSISFSGAYMRLLYYSLLVVHTMPTFFCQELLLVFQLWGFTRFLLTEFSSKWKNIMISFLRK
jgi:hypothetical protein